MTSASQLPGGYTDRASAAIVAAQAHARELGHNRVHPGHLLLGLIDAGDGVGVRVLTAVSAAPPDSSLFGFADAAFLVVAGEAQPSDFAGRR